MNDMWGELDHHYGPMAEPHLNSDSVTANDRRAAMSDQNQTLVEEIEDFLVSAYRWGQSGASYAPGKAALSLANKVAEIVEAGVARRLMSDAAVYALTDGWLEKSMEYWSVRAGDKRPSAAEQSVKAFTNGMTAAIAAIGIEVGHE